MNKISEDTIINIGVIGFICLMSVFIYTQRYVQDSELTATSGILLQKTLHLEQYKLVSNGNGVFGAYSRYTRSDRHEDVLTVYCNKYCKK